VKNENAQNTGDFVQFINSQNQIIARIMSGGVGAFSGGLLCTLSAQPSNPPAGYMRVFGDSTTKLLKAVDDSGKVYQLVPVAVPADTEKV
jgi:hypothetical protein